MAESDAYAREDAGQPPSLHPPYKSTALRSPLQPPVRIPQTLTETTGPGDWDRLIQPLGQGAFDTRAFVQAFLDRGYRGPFGLQCYNIKGDREANAAASMRAWRGFAPAR